MLIHEFYAAFTDNLIPNPHIIPEYCDRMLPNFCGAYISLIQIKKTKLITNISDVQMKNPHYFSRPNP